MRTHTLFRLRHSAAAAVLALASAAPAFSATLLTTINLSITSGAGQSGNAAASSAMIMSDGTSWSGGAVGVQGPLSTRVGGGHPLAANVAFKFGAGDAAAQLDAAYGAGNWEIGAARLTAQYTYYANNNRFGSGAGTFSVYWVGNDNWTQGTNNPAFATDATALAAWSSEYSLLKSVDYAWVANPVSPTSPIWVTDKTGPNQSTFTYDLALPAGLANDAQSGGLISLYLMSTSDTMGMTIFTGGGSILPTLSLDIVSVPEPASLSLVAVGALALLRRRGYHSPRLLQG